MGVSKGEKPSKSRRGTMFLPAALGGLSLFGTSPPVSGVEKLTRSSSKGFLNRALFAYKNGRFSSFLVLGIGLL